LASKQLAVLGSPIEHSKSPAIHAAAYARLGLDWTYGHAEVSASELKTFLQTTQLDAASLTMPLKDEAFQLVTSIDRHALAAKAVNTIIRSPDGWVGFNTDVFGIVQSLVSVEFQSALILGSGATARNSVLAIAELNPTTTVCVASRNEITASETVAFARDQGLEASVAHQPISIERFDLTISTLPPRSDTSTWFIGSPRGTLLDVAYNPWPSQLARQWEAVGGNVVSGIEMLVWQAIAQIRIFTSGNVADSLDNEDQIAAVMRKAAEG
jgi:shikimate dehydrogenase